MKKLTTLLKEINYNRAFIIIIEEYEEVSEFKYYISENFKTAEEIVDILRVDEQLKNDNDKYCHMENIAEVVNDILKSGTYDHQSISENYEGVDLIEMELEKVFLEKILDYFQTSC
ncbi:hypothetical protein P5F12_13450 [Clostridium perfringens]|nr:hypothetical protein [Clostridium perfringens]